MYMKYIFLDYIDTFFLIYIRCNIYRIYGHNYMGASWRSAGRSEGGRREPKGAGARHQKLAFPLFWISFEVFLVWWRNTGWRRSNKRVEGKPRKLQDATQRGRLQPIWLGDLRMFRRWLMIFGTRKERRRRMLRAWDVSSHTRRHKVS